MYILLILLAFILLTISFFGSEINSDKNAFLFDLRLAFIKAFIGIAFFSYIICELLSIFNLFAFNYVLISWLLINSIIIYLNKEKIKLNVFSIFSQKVIIPKKEKNILFLIFFLIVLPILLLAIFIPPNNWDSMAYHLPRVEHWIQNKNIYPYPTNIVRQVLTSPLSEYMIANFQILSSTDAFSNLVQFGSFIFILFSGTLIFSLLKIGMKGQLFLLLAVLSISMVLFQATTTQTDLLATFFFLSFILFGLLVIQSDDNFTTNFIFLALSLSFGILTKYHIAIFAAPIVIYLLFDILKKKNYKNTIFAILISILTLAVVLAPLFLRNIYFFGSITGKDLFDENATIVNSTISIQNMLSNNLKHIVDFISIPINGYNNLLFSVNHSLHNLIGVSENTPGNNWAGETFTVNNHLNEDTAGSILHAALILLSRFDKSRVQRVINILEISPNCPNWNFLRNIFWIFGSTFISCYLVGMSYDYRLSFLAVTGLSFIALAKYQELRIKGLTLLLIFALWGSGTFLPSTSLVLSGFIQLIGDVAIFILSTFFILALTNEIKSKIYRKNSS